jgi:hypothetical protein
VRVAVARKDIEVELSLSQIFQILSVNVFEQVHLVKLLEKSYRKMKRSNHATSWYSICFNLMTAMLHIWPLL